MIKLDIGSGGSPYPGFVSWDIAEGNDARDLTGWRDGEVDEIRASHVLEHLTFADAAKALREWARVLKVGGKLRIAVPDMDWVAKNIKHPLAVRYVMGGQTDANDIHRSAYTEDTLRAALHEAGFDVARERWVSDAKDCAALPVSLNLEGTRVDGLAARDPLAPLPADTVFPAVNVRVICTGPRLGFTDHFACVINSIQALGLPYKFATGAFWHQGIDRLLDECIAEGVDVAVTLDYDTIWIPQQLDYMIHQFMLYPNIDALAPVQPKRETGEVLLNWLNGNPGEVDCAKPMPIASAHFGMTLFRVSSLKRMAKPWLTDIPAPNGGFGDGRIDPDMAFWKRFREAGLNLALCPAVRVGHLEKRAASYDENMVLGYPSVSQWTEKAKTSEPWKSWRFATKAVDQ